MLKNIPLIASIISALTAVTTSLRALGKSREYLRHEIELKIKASCRVGGHTVQDTKGKCNGILIHFIVTIIWFVLSVIFALPVLNEKMGEDVKSALLQYSLPFLLLLILLGLIWWKVLYPKQG